MNKKTKKPTAKNVRLERLVSTHANYVEPKRKVFRVLTNGLIIKVQYKTMFGWEWWNKYAYGYMGGFETPAYFSTRDEAVEEIKYHFGESAEIINEWRAC